MKNWPNFFRGNGKKKNQKELMKDLIDTNKSLNMNISDRLFDLLDENNKWKDKYYKLDSDNKENLKLVELKEKDIKALENKAKKEKSVIEILNNLDNKIDYVIKKIDLLEDILDKFKGNIYEIKPVKKCTGSKQTMQLYSKGRTSSIIKKVVVDDE